MVRTVATARSTTVASFLVSQLGKDCVSRSGIHVGGLAGKASSDRLFYTTFDKKPSSPMDVLSRPGIRETKWRKSSNARAYLLIGKMRAWSWWGAFVEIV